jgi:hypothetical protein
MNIISENFKQKIENIFNNDKLNPLKCNTSGLMCDPVILYIVGMCILLTSIFIMNYCKKNRLFALLSIFINIFIFVGCCLLLINLCIYKKPTIYSYIIIFLSLIAVFVINKVF